MGGRCYPRAATARTSRRPTSTTTSRRPPFTGTSTSLADAPALASEFGGAPTNTVAVTGTGLDPLTFTAALLSSGAPFNENSVVYPIQESGTFMVLEAPPLLAPGGPPTTEPFALTVGAESVAGVSTQTGTIQYSGVPVTTAVVNTADPNNLDGLYGAVDTGGAPLDISGTGFMQAVGPAIFEEPVTGTDLATQYTYDVVSDSEVTALAPAMNPDLVDVSLCSTTGCGSTRRPTSSSSTPPATPWLLR